MTDHRGRCHHLQLLAGNAGVVEVAVGCWGCRPKLRLEELLVEDELLDELSTYDLAEMDKLLCDQSGDLPINRAYVPYDGFPPRHTVGTVATLLMDLRNRQLLLRRGPYRSDQELIQMPTR